MPRKPHPFTTLGLTRSLRKFQAREKREVIRKFLFGKNAHRYPVGEKGETFNEFELDQIIVFIAAAHVDDYVPSTFTKRARATGATGKARRGERPVVELGDDRPRNYQGGRGLLDAQLDVDAVLDELNSHLDGSDTDEGEGHQE